MSSETIMDALRKAKEGSKKRKFTQSIDLAISLRDVNLKDPAKRFKADVLLPYAIGSGVKICVIGDDATVARASTVEGIDSTLTETQITEMAKDAKSTKIFIAGIDYFLAIPQLMATVGRSLGRFLGPAGKMPTVFPPNGNLEDFVTRFSRTCSIRLRQNPVIHCRVGTESMEDSEVVENIRVIITEVENRLDNGVNNIRHTHVKTTMGPAIAIQG